VIFVFSTQELIYSRYIYIGSNTPDVIVGSACMKLTVRTNEIQVETCRRCESQVLRSAEESFQRQQILECIINHRDI